MTSLYQLTDGEVTEFKGRLSRAGFSAEVIREVNRSKDNDLAQYMHDALMRHPAFTIIHGVYNRQDDVFAAFRARCAAKGIDFGKFSWVGSMQAPDFDQNDPETVVVLDATLDTLQNTFEFAWEWTVDGQEDKRRWKGMVSDAGKLALLDGLEFKPHKLRWARIKLDTNVDKKPIDVRDPKSSPGCALLFMSAEHPARIRASDYEKRFGFWLPGLKCRAPGGGRWRNVPYVSFYRGDRRVELDSDWSGSSGGDLAVPSFRE